MKILIVMGGFFPGKKYGGPPVSIDNFCSLMNEQDCFIVTRDHDLFENERYQRIQEGWNNRGNSKVKYLPDEQYNKNGFVEAFNEIKPDILYLQGLFQPCVFPCLQLAKKYNVHVLLAPRGELCEGALKIHTWKKMPYIEAIKALGLVKSIHWQSTSDEETAAIKKLMKATDDHIHRLDNIPSIPRKDYPRREKPVGEGRFIFLSRIHPKKNLLFAISLFKAVEGKVEFDIYGPIEDEEYWKQCQDEINKLPENVTVKYKGLIAHDEVHEIFSNYDAFLFPTLSENYGHVIAESLIVGTPVIISDQTPWRGLEEAGVGWDIPLDCKKEFIESIRIMISTDDIKYKQISTHIKEWFVQKLKIDEIRNIYCNTLSNIGGR